MKTINRLNTILLAVGGVMLVGLLATRPAPAPVPTAAQIQSAAIAIQAAKGH